MVHILCTFGVLSHCTHFQSCLSLVVCSALFCAPTHRTRGASGSTEQPQSRLCRVREAQRTHARADGCSCRAPQTLWPHRPRCSYSAARLQSVIARLASGDVCQRQQLGGGPTPQSRAAPQRKGRRSLADFMWFWCSCKFKCDVLKWIFESMNTHTLLPPTLPLPSSSQSDPAGCDLEMPATRRWRWQLHSGAQIQEWNCHFCPLFPMETMPSTAPSTCYPHSSVHRDQDYPSLTRGTWLVLLALLLQWTSLALCQWPWFPHGCSLPTCWRLFF